MILTYTAPITKASMMGKILLVTMSNSSSFVLQVSKALREHALTHTSKAQMYIKAFAKALEVIPRQLCSNAGFDATDVLNKLRQQHALADGSGKVSFCNFMFSFKGLGFFNIMFYLLTLSFFFFQSQNFGVDVNTGGVVDTYKAFVWEPSLVKLNAIASATEAACLILSVDETVRNPKSEAPDGGPAMPGGGRGRGRGGGRGRGMRR